MLHDPFWEVDQKWSSSGDPKKVLTRTPRPAHMCAFVVVCAANHGISPGHLLQRRQDGSAAAMLLGTGLGLSWASQSLAELVFILWRGCASASRCRASCRRCRTVRRPMFDLLPDTRNCLMLCPDDLSRGSSLPQHLRRAHTQAVLRRCHLLVHLPIDSAKYGPL